jgi:hypothetical protein
MAYKRQSPAPVIEGGTGVSTTTAYSVLCGGTTGTAAFQSVAALGTTGQILTSNGAAALPTWQDDTSTLPLYTDVSSTPYTVTATDQYLSVDTTALTITVELPNAPTTRRLFTVKDRIGAAGTRNITVTTAGGAVTIDGAATYVMNTNFQSINLIFNGTSYEIY